MNLSRKLCRASGVAALALSALALWAPAASATFHLMSVREVYPGSSAKPDSEYVELQMYASGQNLVGGHSVKTYNASGGLVATNTITANTAHSENQRTILLATPAAELQFGVTANGALSPGQLDPSGGAVCWEALDCVSWGSFSGSTTPASGAPVDPLGIPDSMAIRRSIAHHCPTLLEAADDTNASAVDFADASPSPRPNSTVPSESACPPPPTPNTEISGGPKGRSGDRTPTFRFSASLPGSRFRCRIDSAPFVPCTSPKTYGKLGFGRHTFEVKAIAAGRADPSPASRDFRIVKPG
jgi:hypothetical protein